VPEQAEGALAERLPAADRAAVPVDADRLLPPPRRQPPAVRQDRPDEEHGMRITVQVMIGSDGQKAPELREVAQLDRGELDPPIRHVLRDKTTYGWHGRAAARGAQAAARQLAGGDRRRTGLMLPRGPGRLSPLRPCGQVLAQNLVLDRRPSCCGPSRTTSPRTQQRASGGVRFCPIGPGTCQACLSGDSGRPRPRPDGGRAPAARPAFPHTWRSSPAALPPARPAGHAKARGQPTGNYSGRGAWNVCRGGWNVWLRGSGRDVGWREGSGWCRRTGVAQPHSVCNHTVGGPRSRGSLSFWGAPTDVTRGCSMARRPAAPTTDRRSSG
jgi:hypothetical protein